MHYPKYGRFSSASVIFYLSWNDSTSLIVLECSIAIFDGSPSTWQFVDLVCLYNSILSSYVVGIVIILGLKSPIGWYLESNGETSRLENCDIGWLIVIWLHGFEMTRWRAIAGEVCVAQLMSFEELLELSWIEYWLSWLLLLLWSWLFFLWLWISSLWILIPFLLCYFEIFKRDMILEVGKRLLFVVGGRGPCVQLIEDLFRLSTFCLWSSNSGISWHHPNIAF